VPDSKDVEQGFDAARQALAEQLNEIDERLRPYDQLVEARERTVKALAALDGGKASSKRVQWEAIAEYVVEHPGSKPGEIAAALEVPVSNIYAHLARQERYVFDKRKDGIHVKKGWEAQRRERK
jgi:hypothetical protein